MESSKQTVKRITYEVLKPPIKTNSKSLMLLAVSHSVNQTLLVANENAYIYIYNYIQFILTYPKFKFASLEKLIESDRWLPADFNTNCVTIT